ncbi:MAG: hypothetical protein B7Z73_12545 [Planctomycetia bacterium 21-64-5]|nr:MAG: hypothetical protein B7Z73_12545 [Planctomycetia bacterium 21-64-5]
MLGQLLPGTQVLKLCVCVPTDESANLAAQRAVGVQTEEIDRAEVAALWPVANLDDFAAFGWEPRGGYGDAWGHTRIYSNRLSSDYDFGNGYNWLVRQWAYLVQQGTTIVVMRGTRSSLWFDLVGGVYVPRYADKHTLTHSGSVFTLAAPNGTTTNFHDFTQTTYPKGSFASQTTSGGQVIQVTQYHGQQIGEIQRSNTSGGNTTVESFLYTYSGGDFQTVLLRRQVNGGAWTNVSQASYAYYASGDENGSPGDLKTVTTQNWTNGAWQTTGTSYYRYWGGASSSSSSSGGPFAAAHLLKFALNPDAYSKLAAAVGNPLTATDAQVAQYADDYFEYDSQRRVTKEVTEGGLYSHTYSFTTNGNSGYVDAYNNWKMKTVETRPDGSVNTVYTNYVGQVMLTQLTGGGSSWTQYSLFDGNAHVVKYCYPSSVASFNDGQNNLGVTLNASSGLIRTYTYYGSSSYGSSSSSSSSSASAGAAPGYLASESVQEGTGGTPVLLNQYQYTSNTAGGMTIYPLLSQTAYRDDLATEPLTTSFSYSFFAGTNAVSQRTTTLPVVTTGQNGSGLADTRVEQFDQWSNLVSSTDERGVVTDYTVDVVTGAISQRTDDATGMALVTDFQFDSLGRTTQVLGPSHTVDIGGTATTVRTATWTVYQDGINQVWTAQGYATGSAPNYTYTLVNPVSITIFDTDGRTTDESFPPAIAFRNRATPVGPITYTAAAASSRRPRFTTASRRAAAALRGPTTTRPTRRTTPSAGKTRPFRPAARSPARSTTRGASCSPST